MSRLQRMRDERGAILIQVGVAMLALVGFSALAIDYGVLWVAREQAQNAADAGALAAATTLAFDDMVDPTRAEQNAQSFASKIAVWGKPGAVQTDVCADPFDENCATAPGLPVPEPRSSFSATVSVYRDSDHGNALPTYLAGVFGVTSQGIRAQATATVLPANVATCVWPLAIPDNWIPIHPPEPMVPAPYSALCGNPVDERCRPYAKYNYPGGGLLMAPLDLYVPPAFSSDDFTTTAYELSELQEPMAPTGLEPHIFVGVLGPDPANPGVWQPVRRSAFAAVRIGDGDFAGSLTACNPQRVYIGDLVPLEPAQPDWSVIANAVDELNGLDGGATWDPVSLRMRGGCATDGACGSRSPRLVLVPMFDPDLYDQTRAGAPQCGGLPCIRIVNFAGMFLDSTSNGAEVVAHLTTFPGRDVDTTKPFVGYRWAFLRTAVLTR